MYKVLYHYSTGTSTVLETFDTRDEVDNYLDIQRAKLIRQEKERRNDRGWYDHFMKTKFEIVEEK